MIKDHHGESSQIRRVYVTLRIKANGAVAKILKGFERRDLDKDLLFEHETLFNYRAEITSRSFVEGARIIMYDTVAKTYYCLHYLRQFKPA